MQPSIEMEAENAPPAAMIALLALAAALDESGPLPSRVRLAEGGPPVSLAEAAAFLAALPKPVEVAGSISGDVLRLETRDEEHFSDLGYICLDTTNRADDATLGYEFLWERYGEALDDLDVVCFGAGAYLRVRLADLREFDRSYFVGEPGSRGMDFADSGYPEAQGADPARFAGAAAFVSFGSSDLPSSTPQ